jgi:hypothetical protein
MITITPEQRQAIAQSGDTPARVVDHESNMAYVLLRADLYEKYKALFEGDDEIDVRAMYPHMAKVFGPAGWDDPEMDEYNDLDPRRKS